MRHKMHVLFIALLFVLSFSLSGCMTLAGAISGPAAVASCPAHDLRYSNSFTENEWTNTAILFSLSPIILFVGTISGAIEGFKADFITKRGIADADKVFGPATCGAPM